MFVQNWFRHELQAASMPKLPLNNNKAIECEIEYYSYKELIRRIAK